MFHWEGRIAPGFSDKMGTHMDVAPTVMSIVSGGNGTTGEVAYIDTGYSDTVYSHLVTVTLF